MLLLAPTIAPVGGGFLAEAQGWRWVFWLLAIMVLFQGFGEIIETS